MSDTPNLKDLKKRLHVKGDIELAVAIHDLTHELGEDMLGTMLDHVKQNHGEIDENPKLGKVLDAIDDVRKRVASGKYDLDADEVHLEIKVKL